MKNLTIHLVIQNNQATIERAIQSILPLSCDILIANIGSKDNSPSICESFNLKVTRYSCDNRTKLRNNMTDNSKTDWQLILEPWEILLVGHEKIAEIVENNVSAAYFCQLMNENIISKPTRLWKKDPKRRFINEKLTGNEYGDFILWTDTTPEIVGTDYYHQACKRLKERKYQEFMTLAEYYLFHEKNTIQATMIKYYQGIVNCCINNDYNTAIQQALFCLSQNALMAEFWCLLGDIYFKVKEYAKATVFYENALILGSRRLNSDPFPMDISKYDEYPKEMLKTLYKV